MKRCFLVRVPCSGYSAALEMSHERAGNKANCPHCGSGVASFRCQSESAGSCQHVAHDLAFNQGQRPIDAVAQDGVRVNTEQMIDRGQDVLGRDWPL